VLETLKQLQEAVGNSLDQIGMGNDFRNRTQKAQHLRERMNKWDSSDKRLISRIYRELKKLCPQRINTALKEWAHELNGILKGRGTNGQ
jgi:hypothetical protein